MCYDILNGVSLALVGLFPSACTVFPEGLGECAVLEPGPAVFLTG